MLPASVPFAISLIFLSIPFLYKKEEDKANRNKRIISVSIISFLVVALLVAEFYFKLNLASKPLHITVTVLLSLLVTAQNYCFSSVYDHLILSLISFTYMYIIAGSPSTKIVRKVVPKPAATAVPKPAATTPPPVPPKSA